MPCGAQPAFSAATAPSALAGTVTELPDTGQRRERHQSCLSCSRQIAPPALVRRPCTLSKAEAANGHGAPPTVHGDRNSSTTRMPMIIVR
jgi:hypothetical protein